MHSATTAVVSVASPFFACKKHGGWEHKNEVILSIVEMLWIEDKCREKEVDFTKDVIYMYYRDLVK